MILSPSTLSVSPLVCRTCSHYLLATKFITKHFKSCSIANQLLNATSAVALSVCLLMLTHYRCTQHVIPIHLFLDSQAALATTGGNYTACSELVCTQKAF